MRGKQKRAWRKITKILDREGGEPGLKERFHEMVAHGFTNSMVRQAWGFKDSIRLCRESLRKLRAAESFAAQRDLASRMDVLYGNKSFNQDFCPPLPAE